MVRQIKIWSKQTMGIAYIEMSRHRTLVTVLCLIGVFIIYAVLGLRYTGPTYLSDEASYLTKAAFLAGYNVDNASSWHAGYSLLLSPLFMLFSDLSKIWRGALLLNSLMLTLSLALLLNFLRKIFPNRSYRDALCATVLCAFYPGLVVMGGYTFSGALFCLVFLLLLILILRIDFRNPTTVLAPALASSFLYWIHPMGAAVCFAVMLGLLLKAVSERNYKVWALFLMVSIITMATYSALIHPWINSSMTPIGFNSADHYQGVLSNLSMTTPKGFMFRVSSIFIGQITYLLVATYGVVLVGVSMSARYLIKFLKERKLSSNENLSVFIATLSILGVVLMGSILFYLSSITQNIEPDFLIYGRYSEMILLPLLGIGLLSAWDHRLLYRTSILVGLAGLYLALFLERVGSNGFNNLVNTPAFWPQYIYQAPNFIYWMILGMMGVLLATVSRKRYLVVVFITLSILCIYKQAQWHTNLYNSISQPSGIVKYMKNFDENACVGLDANGASPSQLETLVKYKYYLYRHEPQRLDLSKWRESRCEILFTFNGSMFINDPAMVVGREGGSNLYVVAKKSAFVERNYDDTQYFNFVQLK